RDDAELRGDGHGRDHEHHEAVPPAEPELRERVAGKGRERDDGDRDDRRDEERVAEGEPERDRFEHLRRVRKEVAAGDEGQGLAAGRVRPARDDERPPQRVGTADDEGREEPVGEEARAAAEAGAPARGAAPAADPLRHAEGLGGGHRASSFPVGRMRRRAARFFGASPEVDEADRDDQQEEQDRDGRGLTQVPAEERQLPEEQHGGLELPVAAADAARGGDVEQPRFGENLQAADGRRDDDEDQRGTDGGDRDGEEPPHRPGTVECGRFVEVAGHGLHRGEEDEGVVAGPAEVHHDGDRDVRQDRVVLPLLIGDADEVEEVVGQTPGLYQLQA
ncbi:unnamed protein product, partial [Penicillium discolor]